MLIRIYYASLKMCFTITGRGTVATGRIETGSCKSGDPVEIIGMLK